MTYSDPLPEEMILRPSKVKWGVLFLIGFLFAAGGVWMIQDGEPKGWLVALIFGSFTAIAIVPLFSPHAYLRLDRNGFEQAFMGRSFSCDWRDVSEFHVWSMRHGFFVTNRFVGFTRREDEGKLITKFNKAMVGGASQLSDTYGMKAQDLANLMNAYRVQAMARKSSSSRSSGSYQAARHRPLFGPGS